jgi:hypothetical protein
MFFQSRPDPERLRLQGLLKSPRAAFWAAIKSGGGGGTGYFANRTREGGVPGGVILARPCQSNHYSRPATVLDSARLCVNAAHTRVVRYAVDREHVSGCPGVHGMRVGVAT